MIEYAVWLSLRRISKPKKAALLRAFGSAQAVYEAGKIELLAAVPDLRQKDLDSLEDKDMRRTMGILRDIDLCGARVVDLLHPDYPPLLREIHDPPTLLYVRGEMPDWRRYLTVAVVGQRKASAAGLKHASSIAYSLSKSGVLVVSGMAAGIDGAAHRGALDGGTPTVAVLGTAIDKCYPAHHVGLIRDILGQGAVLSEYPPGASTFPGNFLSRNRIISGICRGVVVIEASGRSGALETAEKALEQNRDVFALPGPIDSEDYIGTNRLIQAGAHVVTRAEDILQAYGAVEVETRRSLRDKKEPAPKKKEEVPAQPMPAEPPVRAEVPAVDLTVLARTDPAGAVLAAVGLRAHLDTIIEATGLTADAVMLNLTMLELQGIVVQQPGNYYEKQR